MTKLISKEAKRLSQLKFAEKEPKKIQHTPQSKTWVDYWGIIDREQINAITASPGFQGMAADEDCIAVYYSRIETEQECLDRISKQQKELDAYEGRKHRFYVDIQKRIQEAEEIERLRKERFADPNYIEMLRLKKKFGEM